MSLENLLSNLIIELKNTEKYKNMKIAGKKIKNNPELDEMLIKFSRKNQLLYKANLSKKEVENKITEINNEYKELIKIDEVAEYFKYGEEFNIFINNIFKEIAEELSKF